MKTCFNCGGDVQPEVNTCPRCGAPQTAVVATAAANDYYAGSLSSAIHPSAPAPVAEPDRSTGVPGVGPAATGLPVPVVVAVVAVLLAVSGTLLLVEAIRSMVSIGSALTSGISFFRVFALLAFVISLVLASFGAGLAVVAVALWRGSRVGRAVACLLAGAIAFAEIATTHRTTSDLVALVICLAVAGALALPASARFFAASDERPTAVVVSLTLIGYFAWDFALFGAALVAFGRYDHKDLATGLLMIVASALLVYLNRAMSEGKAWARIVGSLVLTAAVVALLVAEGRELPALALSAVSAGAVAMLWLSKEATEHFSGTPGLRPQLFGSPMARSIVGMVAAFSVVAVVVVGYLPTSNASAFNVSGQSLTPDSGTSSSPPPSSNFNYPADEAQTWGFQETTVDGGSGTVAFGVGNVTPYEVGATNGNDTIGACNVAPASTLMIPFELTFSSTSGAPATLGLSIHGIGVESAPGIAGVQIYEEAEYNDGPACYGENDGDTWFSVFTPTDLAAGTDATTWGFLLVSGYNTTVMSEQQILDGAMLTVPDMQGVGPNEAISATVKGLSGRGLSDNGVTTSFPLSGNVPQTPVG